MSGKYHGIDLECILHFYYWLLIAASLACQMQNGDQGDLPCKASFQKWSKEVMPFCFEGSKLE
jgi:hypothetical protein